MTNDAAQNGHPVSNGTEQTQSPPKKSSWVPFVEKAIHTPRKLRVVCIGAGFAGLTLAYEWKYHLQMQDYIDLAIYEKNTDVGGTWYENRYPGVACDIPAHVYAFSFEPNSDWTTFYASGREIFEYMKRTAQKYNLNERIQFNSRVISSIWDDERGKWDLQIDQNGTIINTEADILISGAGILNKWRWPDIEGLHSFKGTLVHSARWDSDINWTGKKVAIIGNGSSAIQILPKMQPDAAKIVTYFREPTWISANYEAQFTPEGKNFAYTEEQKRQLRENPEELFKLRKAIEHSLNHFFQAMLIDTPRQLGMADAIKELMQTRLNNNPELCAKLIPDWKAGCRRLTPGEGYLEALQEPNVSIESAKIERVDETGIQTATSHEDFDIIVCATGFDVSFTPSWKLIGKNNVNLAEQWRESPEAYLSICVPNIPNYFIFNGPNSPVGHGSLIAVMQWTAQYILRWCKKIATEDIKSVMVSREATEEYNIYSQEILKRTVWTSGCRSWYKNGKRDGKVTAMYGGSILHYKEALESFRTEDFHFEYRSPNRFKFLGNGLADREVTGGDLAFYLTK